MRHGHHSKTQGGLFMKREEKKDFLAEVEAESKLESENKNPKGLNMTQALAEAIHLAYVLAMWLVNINGVQVESHLREKLEEITTTCDQDQSILDCFKDKLDSCIKARQFTFDVTELTEAIQRVCLYIVRWLNRACNMNIDVETTARRKAVESELAKALSLADADDISPLMDLFGIRIINHEGIHDLCILTVKIINILCKPNHPDRKAFVAYAEQNFNELQKAIIKYVLSLPFELIPVTRKDNPEDFDPSQFPDIELPTQEDLEVLKPLLGIVKNYLLPKKNGYQSIHAILALSANSPELAGVKIEFQFRTWQMDNHAENDINASHDVHKDRVKQYEAIFTLSEEEQEKTNVRFFNSSKNVHNDQDGIHHAKVFACRRMNPIS